jgi:hypothetical protein
MQLADFLEGLSKKQLPKPLILYFTGWSAAEFMLIFLQQLFTIAKMPALQEISFKELCKPDRTSFGTQQSLFAVEQQNRAYWIADASEMGSGREFPTFFLQPAERAYAFVSKAVTTKILNSGTKDDCVISVPYSLDQRSFIALAELIAPGVAADRIKKIFTRLSAYHITLSLETSYLFLQHYNFVGKQMEADFEQYFLEIIESSDSLRDLSSAFFDRDGKRFFTIWQKIKGRYAEFFWIAYWSNQIWEAIAFVDDPKPPVTGYGAQQSVAYPASFMRSGKKIKPLLIQFHEALYQLDCSLKVGANEQLLESLFFNYFLPSPSN